MLVETEENRIPSLKFVACKPSSTLFELSSESNSSCYSIMYDESPSQKFKVIHTWRTKPYLSSGRTVFSPASMDPTTASSISWFTYQTGHVFQQGLNRRILFSVKKGTTSCRCCKTHTVSMNLKRYNTQGCSLFRLMVPKIWMWLASSLCRPESCRTLTHVQDHTQEYVSLRISPHSLQV